MGFMNRGGHNTEAYEATYQAKFCSTHPSPKASELPNTFAMIVPRSKVTFLQGKHIYLLIDTQIKY
jgi:hypothetical protein